MSVESITVNGRTFAIVRIATSNRNATARLKGGSIVVGVPARWPLRERERVSADLLRRAVKAIGSGKWKPDRGGKARFFHGQRVRALGREYEIAISRGSRFGAKAGNGRIEVRAAEHPSAESRISALVRREMMRDLLPLLRDRVDGINRAHFQASVPSVTVRDNLSRWGSCGADGAISLNFKLLFMPEGILDYVIVHELAHTRYRSHGPRFWSLVGKVLPDHRERRRWLKENGPSVLAGPGERMDECGIEEPY